MLKRVGLIAFGLLAGLGLGEIALRVVSPALVERYRLYENIDTDRGRFYGYEETLGWIGLPGIEDQFRWIDCSHPVRQNGHGFRGAEIPFERTGARRLLVLGDSFVWGYGVREERMLTERLAALGGPGLEVVNTGVGGFGTDQEYLLWTTRGHRWEPDVVLLMVTLYNDVFDIMFDRRHTRGKPVFRREEDGSLALTNVPVPRGRSEEGPREFDLGEPSWLYGVVTRSAVASLMADRLARSDALRTWMQDRRILPRALPGHGYEYPLFEAPLHPAVDHSWEVLGDLLGMLNDDAALRGAPLVVGLIPASVQVDRRRWEDFLDRAPGDRESYDAEAPNRRLAALCGEHGIPVVDLLGPLREAARTSDHFYYPINNHWTAEGHEVAARALSEALAPVFARLDREEALARLR